MSENKKKNKKEDFNYTNCDFECRIKKKTMFGYKKKYVYVKKNLIIISNVYILSLLKRIHIKNNLIK